MEPIRDRARKRPRGSARSKVVGLLVSVFSVTELYRLAA